LRWTEQVGEIWILFHLATSELLVRAIRLQAGAMKRFKKALNVTTMI